VLHRRIQRPENDIVPDRIPHTLFGYRYQLRRNLLDREQVSGYLILFWASFEPPSPIDGGRLFFFSFPGREREFRDMPERPPRLPVALEAIGA
jgi:hypothetical protein